ncbi:PREDICTED: uncharacterized protein LOC104814167 [Tarenaya hassleriana]|uniref:uncharacterized protein LOC104814167 n=1 Tax=Tarenaya hassleriana TaxID=28532 RepID=UPI00053C5FDF|nr:PREDICTED: uncharacterized protein LOC104814167 [Tarenaya hassleriana]
MVPGYRRSFSRASFDSSELTWSESAEFSSEEEETTSSMYSAGKEKGSTEWTDEKHSLYLKSMEASFVHHLYNSLGNLGSHCNEKNAIGIGSSRRPCRGGNPSQDQVHRAGFWQRMDVNQSEYCFNGSDPCHFRPLAEGQSLDWPMLEGSSVPESRVVCPNGKKDIVICSSGSASTSKQVSSGHYRGQINDREEVSDQNFVDEEDNDKEKPSTSKKMKIGIIESSSNDQVVPYGKAPRNSINT